MALVAPLLHLADVVYALEGLLHGGRRGHPAIDETAHRLHTAIQIYGADQRLHGIGHHAVRDLGHAHPYLQVGLQVQLLGHLHQVGAVGEHAPLPGEPMLPLLGEAMEQLVGDDVRQNSVAQELQALIVRGPGGAVSQCLLQQPAFLEMVTDQPFQLLPGEIRGSPLLRRARSFVA